ncbi:MAG: hypothetical protein K0R28_6073 [Paenibacillus sp.]|jgi:NAD(P)-dependent dehydrogenase (short-subunit alcohol dehydrogenase family)|nr:hypothetical protein [Paenibacillus sp.]
MTPDLANVWVKRQAAERMEMERVTMITETFSGFGLLSAVKLARLGYQVIATMRNTGDQDVSSIAMFAFQFTVPDCRITA